MSEKRSLKEELNSYKLASVAADAANKYAAEILEGVRKRLITGESTGSRLTDLEFLFEEEPNGTKGQKYIDLEERFQAHPGEAVFIIADRVEGHFTFGSPIRPWPAVDRSYYLGQICSEPKLSWSENGWLTLPIVRLMEVSLHNPDPDKPLREFVGGVIPSEIDEKITPDCKDLLFDPKRLIIGTEAVKAYLGPLVGSVVFEGWIHNHFAKLGLPTVDPEGQGRLEIPG